VSVATFVVDQRISISDNDVFDFTDKDRMIATIERFEKPALESSERTLQDRDPMFVHCVLNPGKLVLDQRCKVLGDGRFVRCEDIYRESARLFEGVMAASCLLDTDQD
jgi:hypothetical protein